MLKRISKKIQRKSKNQKIKKYKTLYHCLDDFGEITNIQSYPTIDRPYKRIKVEIFDSSNYPDALM